MAITMTPMSELDSAFYEVDEAEEDLRKKVEKEEDAETEAGKTSGLTAATRLELKNASARYLVLSNVDDAETKDLQRRKVQLRKEIDATEAELTQAARTGREANDAKATLNITAESVKQGKTAAEDAAKLVKDAGSETKKAMGATSANKAQLKTAFDNLEKFHTEIHGRVSTLGDYQRQIETEMEALDMAAARANAKVLSLTTKKQDLQRTLDDVEKDLDDRRGGDLEEAKEDLDTAKQAHDAAPDAERWGKAALKQAREAREDAEERLRLARARRDKVERLFIKGIDVSGPDADGTFTAKAEVRQRIPSTYQLRWSSSAGLVDPETGRPDQVVSFKTKGLSPGSYDIEVRLERVP